MTLGCPTNPNRQTSAALVSTLPLYSLWWCFPCSCGKIWLTENRKEKLRITIPAKVCHSRVGCEATQPWPFPCLVAGSTHTREVVLVSPPPKSGRHSLAHSVGSSPPLQASSGVGSSVHQGDTDHGLSSKREVSLAAVQPCAMLCQAAPGLCSSSIPAWCCTYCTGTPVCAGTSQSSLTQSCTFSLTVLKQRQVFAAKHLEDRCLELLWWGMLQEWKGRCWWPQPFRPRES